MQQSRAHKQNYMHGAAILTIGVVIMKILGAIYKIPLGNILGDEGYSMFISAYSIYNIFFTLATAGLPVALSRLIAEADANGRIQQEEKTFKVAFATFFVIGLAFASIMFFFPEWLAANYLENPDAAMSIKAMAPAIFLVCLVSAYRGYCQGNGNMIPTTVDEVLEVLFKVISGLILSYSIIHAGLGLKLGSAGAILGVSIGSVVSLGYMIVYRRKNYKILAAPYTSGRDPNDIPDDDALVDPALKIVKDILRIGIPIAFGASIMALLNSIDSKLCMNRLQSAAGFDYSQAKILYGIYGKAQTIFNLPAAFITPLTVSIVPAIAAAIVKGHREESTKVSEDSMRIAAVISMPMSVGIAVMSYPIMNLMYPHSNEAGPVLLSIMGISSFFVCITLLENAILQASGKERLPMYAMIIGSLVKIAVNWFLVATPSINIYGAPIGTLCGYVTMAVLDFIFIFRALKLHLHVGRILGKPLFCSLFMGIFAYALYALLRSVIGTESWLKLAVCSVIPIGAAAVVYVVAVILTHTVTAEDMNLIPGGGKLAKLLHIK